MAEVRFREVYNQYLKPEMRKRYREEGKKYSKEALEIYPDSVEVNYILGRLFYKKSSMPEPEDKIARDYFMKVIENDPEHVNANISLSELYFKHKNKEKARYYAERALKSDQANVRARQLLLYIKKYNK